MGLLTEGHTLTWNEIKDLREQLQINALNQLIRIYQKYNNRQGDAFTWGDEVKLLLIIVAFVFLLLYS